jgi:hypothetical protein
MNRTWSTVEIMTWNRAENDFLWQQVVVAPESEIGGITKLDAFCAKTSSDAEGSNHALYMNEYLDSPKIKFWLFRDVKFMFLLITK